MAVLAAAYGANMGDEFVCVGRAAYVALWSHVSLPRASRWRAGSWSRELINLLTHLLVSKFLPSQDEREL